MKIRITTIPIEGAEITDTLPKGDINERVAGPSGSDFVFLEDIKVKVNIKPYPGGAELKGEAKSSYKQPCSRCTEEKERPLNITLKDTIKPKPETAIDDEDIGVIYYSGEHLELDDFIQESVILALSIFWSPEIDEQTGKCKECKLTSKDLGIQEPEKKSTLGDLLKKAGVK